MEGLSQIIDWGVLSNDVCHKLGVEKKSKFIVMDALGESLRNLLDSGEIHVSKVDVYKLGIQLFKIIERLHDMGICHLDIKPDNVMLGAPVKIS